MSDSLAIHGGSPVRTRLLPYGRQQLDDDDIAAVVEVLKSDWLTTGPMVGEFEDAFAQFVGAKYAVAVSNGTAALHAAMHALDVGAGDEVIVTPMTFAASANCILYQGGRPVFVDVEPDTLLIDPSQVKQKITRRTKAIVAVDYAGQPCDYDALREIADEHGLAIVADACHAVGGSYKGRQVGTLAELNTFSFHPVKHMTTGEGGMITTNDAALAERMRTFRNHGITSDHHQRAQRGSFFYEMVDLGYNYRITDFQCALGLSQLRKLPTRVRRRQEYAAYYTAALEAIPEIRPLVTRNAVRHAYHLYVVRLDLMALSADRDAVYAALRAEGIGVNVHYIPVHLHPFYCRLLGTCRGTCPVAEESYERALTLPLFAGMSTDDLEDVVTALDKVIGHYRRGDLVRV